MKPINPILNILMNFISISNDISIRRKIKSIKYLEINLGIISPILLLHNILSHETVLLYDTYYYKGTSHRIKSKKHESQISFKRYSYVILNLMDNLCFNEKLKDLSDSILNENIIKEYLKIYPYTYLHDRSVYSKKPDLLISLSNFLNNNSKNLFVKMLLFDYNFYERRNGKINKFTKNEYYGYIYDVNYKNRNIVKDSDELDTMIKYIENGRYNDYDEIIINNYHGKIDTVNINKNRITFTFLTIKSFHKLVEDYFLLYKNIIALDFPK